MTADYIIDRRKLRRALTRWRILAIFAALLALGAVIYATTGYRLAGTFTDHVARITISGVITGDKDMLAVIDRARRSASTKAVIVSISSPGGTVPGAEALYDAFRRLAKEKPTIAVVENMAASGGYIAALGTDRIFARQTALVGSIGVLFQIPNVSKLLDNVGVKVEQIKSTPLKAEPSGFTPTSEAARAAMDVLIADTYAWFKALVKERRNYDDATLAQVTDGRIFTGRQSLELKLIDAIGDEVAAMNWLVDEKKIARRLPIRDWRPAFSPTFGWLGYAAGAARLIGFDGWAATLERSAFLSEVLAFEGLMAIWRPAEK